MNIPPFLLPASSHLPWTHTPWPGLGRHADPHLAPILPGWPGVKEEEVVEDYNHIGVIYISVRDQLRTFFNCANIIRSMLFFFWGGGGGGGQEGAQVGVRLGTTAVMDHDP